MSCLLTQILVDTALDYNMQIFPFHSSRDAPTTDFRKIRNFDAYGYTVARLEE